MNPEMKPWNDKAAATGDPQTQGTWPDSLRDEWRAMLAADRPLEAVWHGGAFPLQRRRESEAMVDLCENISHRVIVNTCCFVGKVWRINYVALYVHRK